jgi:hypothetical protein
MRQCPRCSHWHHATDSDVCDRCWEDMGQMTFWHDDEDYEPPIDTFFDQQEEARGWQ